MSTSAEVAPTSAATRQPSRVGQAYLASVRVLSARSIGTSTGRLWLTLVKLPNPDEFSTGATLELRSTRRLAQPGEDWSGWVRLGGYARQYKATDSETGEQIVVRTADIRLTVIEG